MVFEILVSQHVFPALPAVLRGPERLLQGAEVWRGFLKDVDCTCRLRHPMSGGLVT